MKIVHSKKNNLGLIFEYLLQEIVESVIKKDDKKKKKLIEIISKYFYKNQYLKEEFSVFTALLNGDHSDKDDAKRYLVECLKLVENLKFTLNERKQVKQELLSEIYKVVDKSVFFEHNIKNYPVYATINLIIDYYGKNKKMSDINHLIDLERKLVEHIQDNKVKKFNKEQAKRLILEARTSEEKLGDNAQLIATVKFRSNFYNKLNEQQKELIDFYLLTTDPAVVQNKLDKHYRINHNDLKKKYMTETVEFTKTKLKESLSLFEEHYKSADSVEDKLKIVLDSFVILEN